MRFTIIGANGFVGSAFVRRCRARGHNVLEISRENYAQHAGLPPTDVTIEAACNSKKYLAEKEPFQEFAESVEHRLQTLQDFPAFLQLHVSSVDVYNDLTSPRTTREDVAILPEASSFYGVHKLMAEQLVRKYADRWLILRLAGMVGDGLRKNPVHDILHGGSVHIHPESRYQFMTTDAVADNAIDLVEQGIRDEVFNVCGSGTISPREIAELAGKQLTLSPDIASSQPRIVEASIDKISAIRTMPDTLDTIAAFISASHSQGVAR